MIEGKFWCVHLTEDSIVLKVDDIEFAAPEVEGVKVEMVYVRAIDINSAIAAARKLQKKFQDRERV